MKPGTKVKVASPIPDWPRASSLEPPVGIVGVVLGRRNNHAYGCAPERIPVRFKGAEVGYDWEVDKGVAPVSFNIRRQSFIVPSFVLALS